MSSFVCFSICENYCTLSSWYAIATMAKDLSISRSTIKRALAELIRRGRVKKHVRFRKNGGSVKEFSQNGLQALA